MIDVWSQIFLKLLGLALKFANDLEQIHIFGSFKKVPHTGNTDSLDVCG